MSPRTVFIETRIPPQDDDEDEDEEDDDDEQEYEELDEYSDTDDEDDYDEDSYEEEYEELDDSDQEEEGMDANLTAREYHLPPRKKHKLGKVKVCGADGKKIVMHALDLKYLANPVVAGVIEYTRRDLGSGIRDPELVPVIHHQWDH